MKKTLLTSNYNFKSWISKQNGRPSIAMYMVAILMVICPSLGKAQQFVKTYKAFSPCGQTSGNLTLNCITKSKKTTATFYVAGTQDSSIYLAELDAMGVVLQEKLIGVNSNTYSLRSMITDDDGNIVIVGNNTVGYPFISYIMKVSPSLSLLLHRTYNNIDLTGFSQLLFLDVKDYKASNTYYVAGGIRNASNTNGSDAILLRLDRNTGSMVANNTLHAGEDNYDALVFGSSNNPTSTPSVVATGRFSVGGTSAFRPWIVQHSASLNFSAGARYVQDNSQAGRLYSSSLIGDAFNNVLYCWHGDMSGALDVGINIGAASFKGLSVGWQKEYIISPQPQFRKFLNQIAADPNGYVTEGNWWDRTSTALGGYIGEMFLIRTTKAGTPVWSRKLNNILVNSGSHNAGFVIDGKSIYAVGYRANNNSQTDGILVRIPLLDGAMDTACASIQTVVVKDIQFSKRDSAVNKAVKLLDSLTYFPINCIRTDTITNCNQPCTDTLQLDADFDLSGKLVKGASNFIVTADNFNTSSNSQWIVSEVNLTSFGNVPGTIWIGAPNGPWGVNSPTQFNGYFGAENSSGTPGNFLINKRYRFKHILSSTNSCGLVPRADTVVKTIFMCPSCRTANGTGIIVETEKSSTPAIILKSNIEIANLENDKVRIMPNPVNGSTVMVEFVSENNSPVQVTIQDIQGRKLLSKQFSQGTKNSGKYAMDVSSLPNGNYVLMINNDGKSSSQKFVVAR